MIRKLLIPLLLLLAACEPAAAPAAAPESRAIVDSVIPIAEALARFRSDIPVPPAGLRGGASSVEELAREVVALTLAGDTAGFERLALDRGEFAWFYYEQSPLAQPPYELPPALTWFRMQQVNRTGVFRLMREMSERDLRLNGVHCADSRPFGNGAGGELLSGCTVTLEVDGEARNLRLFGAVLQREGRFKIVTFENDF